MNQIQKMIKNQKKLDLKSRINMKHKIGISSIQLIIMMVLASMSLLVICQTVQIKTKTQTKQIKDQMEIMKETYKIHQILDVKGVEGQMILQLVGTLQIETITMPIKNSPHQLQVTLIIQTSIF